MQHGNMDVKTRYVFETHAWLLSGRKNAKERNIENTK
jgi:hypothetical protein